MLNWQEIHDAIAELKQAIGKVDLVALAERVAKIEEMLGVSPPGTEDKTGA